MIISVSKELIKTYQSMCIGVGTHKVTFQNVTSKLIILATENATVLIETSPQHSSVECLMEEHRRTLHIEV